MIQTLKYKTVFVAALVAAAATLFSCTQDETVQERSQQPIGFNVVVDNSKNTRSVSTITTADLTKFDVWAYKADREDANPVMGVSSAVGYQISKSSTIGVVDSIQELNHGVWGYSNKYQITLWPNDGTQQLAFYAVAPTTVYNTVPNLTLDITKNNHAFTYTASDTHSDQRDIIIAGKTVKLTDINHLGPQKPEWPEYTDWMTVALTFNHALSQIKFDAKLKSNYPDFKVIIHSITLCNVYRSGTCTIGSTDGSASWANYTEKERDAYTVVTGETGTGITLYSSDGVDGAATTVVPLSNGTTETNSDNLMLIPQQITAWDPASGLAPDDEAQTGAYLKIKCEITQNDYNLLGTNEEYVYVPFAGTQTDALSNVADWDGWWLPGKTYTYHLEFGLGYDSAGQSYGSEIKFNVSVGTDWTGGSVIPLL